MKEFRQMRKKSPGQPEYILIGVACENGVFTLGGKAAQTVRESRLFSGGKRQFRKVEPLLPPGGKWIEIGGDIEKTVRAYEESLKNTGEPIVIFASGDPLFYGIGSTLKRVSPGRSIEVFPAPNSVQTLCRKTVIPYENIAAASVHGRDWHEFDSALISGAKLTGLLTDAANSPRAAARRMMEYGFENYRCVVGENLGEKDERIGEFSVRKTAETDFRQPSTMIVERTGESPRPCETTLKDCEFQTLADKPGMITKLPARMCAIARLGLGGAERFWDIGFCTGSVSVEARRGFPRLRVTAFEKNPLCEKLIEANSKNLSAPGIKVIMGDFFDSSPGKLPAPDAVFIGGHGGRLENIIGVLEKTVRPGGKIVMNSVTEKSGKTFRQKTGEAGFEPEEPVILSTGEGKKLEILSAVKK